MLGLNALRELGEVGMPLEELVVAPPPLGIGRRLDDKLGIFDILCIVLLLGGDVLLLPLLLLLLLPLIADVLLLLLCLFARFLTCCWNV